MPDTEIAVVVEADPADAAEQQQTADPVAELEVQLAERKAETERERAGREAERQRADAEASKRAEAEKEVETARTEVSESRLSTIEQGLAAAQTASDAAKAKYQAAMEAADWAKAADAQVEIADARSDLKRLTEAKADLEVTKAPPAEKRNASERLYAPDKADPVETFLSRCSPATAKWLRDHPDDARVLATNSDPRRAAKMTAAHNDAVAEGCDLDTPEYFSHVEKFLGMSKPVGNGAAHGAQQQRRSGAAPVAPVAQGGSPVNGGDNVVRLTKGEAAAATDGTLVWNYDDPSPRKKFKKGDPIGNEEFARRKRAMQERGQYDKTYYES